MARDSRTSFPTIPPKHWWELRERFKRSIPSVVDPKFLSSALNMTQQSAQANIFPGLRATGLVNDDGTPSKRAVAWRDDAQYAEVCAAIVKEVYPQALLDLALDPHSDRDAALRWLANTTGAGANAVGKMFRLLALLLEADPSGPSSKEKPPATPRSVLKAKPAGRRPPKKEQPASPLPEAAPPEPQSERKYQTERSPSIHFNVQIHISPEATADQIDTLFASMARHLKDLIG